MVQHKQHTGLVLTQANPLLALLDLSSSKSPVDVSIDEKVYPEDHLMNSFRDYSMDGELLSTDVECHLGFLDLFRVNSPSSGFSSAK